MTNTRTTTQNAGFIIGIVIFVVLLILPAPEGLSVAAKKTAAVGILMAVFWISEAVPIFVTALFPLILFPSLGVINAVKTAASYGDRTVYLFLGAFCLAIAIEKSGLHKRIALFIIRLIGLSPNKILLGFMVSAAFISMWISNTATALMMLPIAISVLKQLPDTAEPSAELSPKRAFAMALMLGIAYSANIGGIGTLVGTPPNIIFAGIFRQTYTAAPEITFLQWMRLGVPLVVIFLPITYLFLIKFGSPFDQKALASGSTQLKKALLHRDPMGYDEKAVLILFAATAALWIFRKNVTLGLITIPGWSNLFPDPAMLHDSTVAVFTAVLLFIIPSKREGRSTLLVWSDTRELPWGILLLFGGGFALAAGVQSSGLSAWIAANLQSLGGVPILILIVIICLIITFLTEITSNTAVTATFLPVLGASAVAMSLHPLLLMIPATLSASCAFMLPSGTPPNAVVFSSGYLTIPKMAKSGFILNLIGVIIITCIMYFIAFHIFGIQAGSLPEWAAQ